MKTMLTFWGVPLLIIISVTVLIDLVTGSHTLGVVMRFVTTHVTALGTVAVRFLEGFTVAALMRRRALKLLTMFAGISAISYGLRVVLKRQSAERMYCRVHNAKAYIAAKKGLWHTLPTPVKFGAVAVIIGAQFVLVPKVAQYIVLFPARFMGPVVKLVSRRVSVVLADSAIAALYWRLFSKPHKALACRVQSMRIFKRAAQALGIMRLSYLTAWRLWKYDPQYRKADGELKRDFIEPYRLWKKGVLQSHYRCRVLLGKRQLVSPQ